jgi:hypothetical protein
MILTAQRGVYCLLFVSTSGYPNSDYAELHFESLAIFESLSAIAVAHNVSASAAAMSSNIALLRRSLCANPWLEERIALFGTGEQPHTAVVSAAARG